MSDKCFIGIPVLNRIDLLAQCLQSIDAGAEVVLVENNVVSPSARAELLQLSQQFELETRRQTRNIGVAASWNLLIRIAFERGYDRLIIGSNDSVLYPDSLFRALQYSASSGAGICLIQGFNFFLLKRSTVERVGWFDENFYPAYKEDQDYAYRMKLAGLALEHVPAAGANHVGSATIRSNSDYETRNQATHFDWNQNHYLMKWGGDYGSEKFVTPYDRQDRGINWWPDPGCSICQRDWDRDFWSQGRDLAANTVDELAALNGAPDETHRFYERWLSGEQHLTVFHSGLSDAVVECIIARPRELVCYGLIEDRRQIQFERISAIAGIAYRTALLDVFELECISPTDILLIDSWHTADQLVLELRHAPSVRRRIIVAGTNHQTIKSGCGDFYGCRYALEHFLATNSQWTKSAQTDCGEGLIVIERAI